MPAHPMIQSSNFRPHARYLQNLYFRLVRLTRVGADELSRG